MPGRFLLPNIFYRDSMSCEITINNIIFKISWLKNIDVFIKRLSPMEVLELKINLVN